jgi:tripartite-type tricarboxylate transporter receptor subunit TctC
MLKHILAITALLASLAVNANPPVKVIVAYPVGGGTDIIARYLEAKLNNQIYIDNKAGASGMIGTNLAAKAAPDGKTLLMGHVTPNAINVGAYMTPQMEVSWDFDPIVMVATAKEILIANKSFTPNTIAELKEYGKNNIITYASDGIGSVAHILMEQTLKGNLNIHVPYKGGAPALQSVLVNETRIAYSPQPVAINWINSGKVKVIHTYTSDELWWGLFAPKGTNPKILDYWHDQITTILKEPSTQEWMKAQGYNLKLMSRNQFSNFVKQEQDKYKTLKVTNGQNP